MSFDASDAFTGGLSDCCGAPIMLGEMCSDCKEHCNPQEEEEDEEEKKDNPADLRADYEEQQWKDEGKREREELIGRMKEA